MAGRADHRSRRLEIKDTAKAKIGPAAIFEGVAARGREQGIFVVCQPTPATDDTLLGCSRPRVLAPFGDVAS